MHYGLVYTILHNMLKKYHEFIPKSFVVLKHYTWGLLKKDFIAGITVGIVSLPLGMAFAMASGVSPEKGLFTAIVAGFLISLLSGSRVQIGGPTGAFVLVVYNIVERHGYDGLALATLIAGGLLIVMGVFKLGTLIKFVPHPLIIGFTTGIAVVVFSLQIKELFGLHMEYVPVQFVDKWKAYFQAFPSFDKLTTCVGLGTVAFIFALRRWAPSIPWGVAGIIVATAVCAIFHLPVATVASRFGELPHSLPMPSFHFDYTRALDVLPDAITIALLAGIESLLSAVIADGLTGGRHKPNIELIGQGVANIGSVIFGGIPATAAIARTATNIKTGAQTPIAGMMSATVVLVLLWSCSTLVGGIPLVALSAILIAVAWQMSELPHFIKLTRTSKGDVAILATSFLLTVLLDLTVAVEVGMLMAAFFFMKQMSDLKHVISLEKKIPEQDIEVYKLRGPFFFGVTDRLKSIMMQMEAPPKTIIIRMKHVPVIDATALQTLREMHLRFESKGSKLILVEVQPEPTEHLKKYGLGALISLDN